MSVQLMAAVFSDSETTGNDRLVLLALADEADDDGTNCFPSQRRIAAKARTSLSTTVRCLDRLVACGEIEIERPEKKGRGHLTKYVVLRGLKGSQSESDALSRPDKRAETRRNAPKGSTPLAKSVPTHIPMYSEPVEKQKLCDSVAEQTDRISAEAHRLTVLAFEQPVKPTLRENGKGAFVAVLGIIRAHLEAGRSPSEVEAAIRAGVDVWTKAGVATSIARTRGNGARAPDPHLDAARSYLGKP